jgi:hypothetical protein
VVVLWRRWCASLEDLEDARRGLLRERDALRDLIRRPPPERP